MNRTTVSPAPARTDVASPALTSSSSSDAALARTVQRRGYGMAAGAAIWASSIFAVGSDPTSSAASRSPTSRRCRSSSASWACSAAMALTGATGTTRAARFMIRVERVLLGLATLWTVIHGCFPALRDAGWLAVLDVFWPLSMLGMFVIGIKVAVAGRWRGVARIWPMVAESWAVVTIPTFVILGEPFSNWVGGGHLLVGYGILGLIVARRTALVLPRR